MSDKIVAMPVVLNKPVRTTKQKLQRVSTYAIGWFLRVFVLMLVVGVIHTYTAIPAFGFLQVAAIMYAVELLFNLNTRDKFNDWLKDDDE